MPTVHANPKVGWRKVGDDIVLFNCGNHNMAVLNETGSFIWPYICQGTDLFELISVISRNYQINEDTCRDDLIALLEDLNRGGFIYEYLPESLKSEEAYQESGEDVLLSVEMSAIEKLVPFAATFETTYRCNEKCAHCYMGKGIESMTLEEIKEILAQLAEAGCLFVTFTGGEFFIRSDVLEIIDCADRLHFVIDILTNGTLIDKRIAEFIAGKKVRRVQVSLYGSNHLTHDRVTRVCGSFNRTIEAIKILRQFNIKVEIAYTMMNFNFYERFTVHKLVKEMGCYLSPNPIVTARNNGDKDTFNLRLTDEQIEEFWGDKEFSDMYAGRKPFKDHQLYFGFRDILEAAPCYSGFNSCAITPDGKVLPCNQLMYEVGDLRKNSFHDIWTKSERLAYLRSLKLRNLKGCSNCRLLPNCSRCPGLALIEGGDLLGPSLENCRVTRICDRILTRKEGRD